jgi:VanZ family protein
MPPSPPRFSSDRERRLWIWTLAVVLAIYSTLGLAGTLAETLLARGKLDLAYVVSFLCVILAIAGTALRKRPDRREVWLVLGMSAVFVMVVVRMGIGPAERTHLFEYGLVAVLIYQALTERARNGRKVPFPAVVTVVVTSALGWIDEGIQALLPNRVYDLRDVGTNAFAAVMATLASVVLAWARAKIVEGRSGRGSG